jgi:hydrogenase nickel insertion protein HypA
MHELGIAQDLFRVILTAAKKNSINKIVKIVIKVGEGSGIEHDFLRHTFKDHIIPGTIAENAELEIIHESIKLKCKDCNKEITMESINCCPYCKGKNTEIISGKDVYVESIEG